MGNSSSSKASKAPPTSPPISRLSVGIPGAASDSAAAPPPQSAGWPPETLGGTAPRRPRHPSPPVVCGACGAHGRAERMAHAARAARAAVLTVVRCGAAQYSATGRLGSGCTLASARAAASMSISFKTPTMRSHTLSRCSFLASSSIDSFPTTVFVCAISSVRVVSLSLSA